MSENLKVRKLISDYLLNREAHKKVIGTVEYGEDLHINTTLYNHLIKPCLLSGDNAFEVFASWKHVPVPDPCREILQKYGQRVSRNLEYLLSEEGYRSHAPAIAAHRFWYRPKTYVFSKYMHLLFSSTQGDVLCDHLHKDSYGFIYLEGLSIMGHQVLGTFFNIEKDPGNEYNISLFILRVLPNNELQTRISYLPLPSGKMLLEELRHRSPDQDDDSSSTFMAYDSESHRSFCIILNAILFAVNCTDDLKEELNEFAHKKSKREAQERIYTANPFFLIGSPTGETEEEIQERTQNVTHTFVKGHMYWQAWGPKWSKLRLRYRKPGVRVYKEDSQTPTTKGE
jgi:hypothetical protein